MWISFTNGGKKRRRNKSSFDFNCKNVCGKYNEDDRVGKNLHRGCTAMKQTDECMSTFVKKKKKDEKKNKKKNKKRKSDGDRIVGGHAAKNPMPWMVLINIKGSQCGGTLINNEFVLTAAHCFCGSAGLCDRMIMEVEENVVNKIRVSSK